MNFRNPKNQVTHNIELLAPVGGFDMLHASLNAGCDSIFFGIQGMNMRSRSANNFTFADLPAVVELCRKYDVKTYLTVNTVLYDSELSRAYKIIDKAKESGINSVICSDMSAILYANRIDQPVHISTQLSLSNIESVRFYAQFSDTIVLARELTLPMVKKIVDQIDKLNIVGRSGVKLKIEIFGHGAICVAISGRCSMSLLTENSSANKGACMQPCRRQYKVTDVDTNKELMLENDFVMSPSDLCTIGMLDQIADSGVSILKLEGRGRTADFVDRIVRVYKEALNSLNSGEYTKEEIIEWNKQLGTVFNRGLSDSFYMGKRFVEWCGVYGNKATERKTLLGTVTNYYKKIGVVEIDVVHSELKEGDRLAIIGDTTGVARCIAKGLVVDNQSVQVVVKGHQVTFPLNQIVRKKDRLYKLEDISD
jgi:U32 family peptidase